MSTFWCPGSGLGKRSEHGSREGRRMFREGRPSLLRLRFGLHFGVILGAKFATILLFGGPGGQNRLTKERLKEKTRRGHSEGVHKGCSAQGGPPGCEGFRSPLPPQTPPSWWASPMLTRQLQPSARS